MDEPMPPPARGDSWTTRRGWARFGGRLEESRLDSLVADWLAGSLSRPQVLRAAQRLILASPEGCGMLSDRERRHLASGVRAARIFAHREVFLASVELCDANGSNGAVERRAVLEQLSRSLGVGPTPHERSLLDLWDHPDAGQSVPEQARAWQDWTAGKPVPLAMLSTAAGPDLAADSAAPPARGELQRAQRGEEVAARIRDRMRRAVLTYCEDQRIAPKQRRQVLEDFRKCLGESLRDAGRQP